MAQGNEGCGCEYFPLQMRGDLASLVYAVVERAADFIEDRA